jgi:hypothetical protein
MAADQSRTSTGGVSYVHTGPASPHEPWTLTVPPPFYGVTCEHVTGDEWDENTTLCECAFRELSIEPCAACGWTRPGERHAYSVVL